MCCDYEAWSTGARSCYVYSTNDIWFDENVDPENNEVIQDNEFFSCFIFLNGEQDLFDGSKIISKGTIVVGITIVFLNYFL